MSGYLYSSLQITCKVNQNFAILLPALLENSVTTHEILQRKCRRAHQNLAAFPYLSENSCLSADSCVVCHGNMSCDACLAGNVQRMLLARDYEGAKKEALWLKETFGENNFFLEVDKELL